MAVAPAARSRERRPRRWLRWLLTVQVALLVLAAAALGLAYASFDPDALKPRITAAVEARTGRQMVLAGPVGLKLSLFPTVTLEDVTLANTPGGSRPEMARVGRVEAEFALLPLLSRRLELRRVVLRSPDLLLETDAEGRPNWAFAPPAAGQTSPADASPKPPAGPTAGDAKADTPRPPPFSVERVTVTEGRLVYRNGVTGRTRTLAVERFRTEPVAGSAGLLRLDGAVTFDELPVTVAGEVGGPERLFGASEASPWPVRLQTAFGGAEVRVEGTAAQPLKARGWRVAVAAKVPDLARFAATAPNLPTPPLRDIDFAAILSDPGPEAARRFPRFSDLRFSLDANDLSWILPGLRLSAFRVDAPRDDAPFALEAEAAAGDLPLRVAGKLGAPRPWVVSPAAPEPWPIDVLLEEGRVW